jgi:hypothetical protein
LRFCPSHPFHYKNAVIHNLETRMKFGTVATFTGVLLGLAHAAAALELTLLDTWSDTFPATTTTWRVQASAPAEVGWQLVLGSATVDRGQRTVADAAQPIDLPVRTPALRDGVPGQATLLITATAGGQSARLEHPVYSAAGRSVVRTARTTGRRAGAGV